MIEKLKHIHHMFYVGLIFMAFPFASIFLGQIPWWHFFLAIFFMMSYLGILIVENMTLTWIFWIYLLVLLLSEQYFDLSFWDSRFSLALSLDGCWITTDPFWSPII